MIIARPRSAPVPPAAAPAPVTVLCSVDTEEDNWVPTRDGLSARNVLELPRLDALLARLGVRATYFASYQAAVAPGAAEILRALADGGRAEVGAHLHPWNTPPFDEPLLPRNTMANNLPYALQLAKLRRLTARLGEVLGRAPTSFRAGRLGLGADTARALAACGYRVDSSVAPFHDLREPDGGPDFSEAPLGLYRLDARGADVRVPSPTGELVEVPLSCGFSRRPFAFWHSVHARLTSPAGMRLHLPGIASRSGIVRKIVLSPERAPASDMLTLSRRLIEGGATHLHVVFHSCSLLPGVAPYVRSARDLERFYGSIERYVEGLGSMAECRFATVGEAAREWLSPAGVGSAAAAAAELPGAAA